MDIPYTKRPIFIGGANVVDTVLEVDRPEPHHHHFYTNTDNYYHHNDIDCANNGTVTYDIDGELVTKGFGYPCDASNCSFIREPPDHNQIGTL